MKKWFSTFFMPYKKMPIKTRFLYRVIAIPIWLIYLIIFWNLDYTQNAKIIMSLMIVISWSIVLIYDYKKLKRET
ncbi:hypothetical protein ACFVRR_15830 [Gottfriedia sp. NPDC057948]|uniref:hypothetical protein n=1 Tax=Gottfriedia sp. NPDC057948 TaxID=3346287 RepID=UPI0036D980F7